MPLCNFIGFLAGEHIGKCRLAGTVRPHDGMNRPLFDRKVEAVEDFLTVDLDVQVCDFKQCHPTEPSSEIEISFCASTANSIGNCCSTSLTKPLTIRATASSADKPRWRQ